MKKVLAGLVAGVALLGLAACGDTDSTTTQGVDGTVPPADTGAMPDPMAPAPAPDAMPPADTGAAPDPIAPAPAPDAALPAGG